MPNSLDDTSRARLAGIRPPRRCPPTPAGSSMTARGAAVASSPKPATAACSARMGRCRVHRFKRRARDRAIHKTMQNKGRVAFSAWRISVVPARPMTDRGGLLLYLIVSESLRRLSWEARKSQPSAAVVRRLRCRLSRSASASFSSATVRHSADVRNMRPPITLQGAVCSRRYESESVQNRTVRALDSRRPNLRRSGTAR